MKGLFDDPDKHIVQWPNTALNESKARRFEGQIKQPDFAVSIICQLQTNATIFEVRCGYKGVGLPMCR
ncbi:19658_t:CDS:2 [Entrophospora sp. SA101]|nr:19658_t:CDS:2 [Entrophospora sp. SA101]